MGSFDRNAFWQQMLTRNVNGREYRALTEGTQSVTNSVGGGWLAPIAFSANILELARAASLWTSPGVDGAINGPQVVDMKSQVEYIPSWNSDAANIGAYVGEGPTLTPGTAALGVLALQARTAASIQLASRQLVEGHMQNGNLADLIEVNTALAISRTMDTSALYGAGTNAPWGIFSSQYSGSLQVISMGTNGAAFSAAGTRGMFGPFSQAIQKVRTANEDGPVVVHTNPAVAANAATGLSTLDTYISPPADVSPYWPPRQTTAFSQTETQGTSSLCSSALICNPNRVILGLRTGLVLSQLDQRYAEALQYGYLAYVRHDWAFPYAAQACAVRGILTT